MQNLKLFTCWFCLLKKQRKQTTAKVTITEEIAALKSFVVVRYNCVSGFQAAISVKLITIFGKLIT